MSVKRVFLDSRHAQGPTYDKLYTVPLHSIQCTKPTQRIDVLVSDFRATYTWRSVNAGNNAFTLTPVGGGAATHIVLAPGNYTFCELAETIHDAIAQAGIPDAAVEYGRPYNTLMFTFGAGAMTLSFDNASYGILGFAPTDVPSGTTITSTAAIDLSPIDVVWVCLEGVGLAGNSCIANLGGGELRAASVLATIPVDSEPFARLTYTPPNADAAIGLPIADRNLRTFRIVMCDGTGAPLMDFPDYTMGLIVRIVDTHVSNMDANLGAIRHDVALLTELFSAEFTVRHMDEAAVHFGALYSTDDADAGHGHGHEHADPLG